MPTFHISREYLRTLPEQPGVYKYRNEEGEIIYIGKAKNLKKRVSSYFQKHHDRTKTKILVRNIRHIEYTIVDTEVDALLLESNLIRKHQPRYNIQLKDDKSFPWICIKKNERFPRIFRTRKVVKDSSEYYGPFANIKIVDSLLELIETIYPIHNAKYEIDETNYTRSIFGSRLQHYLRSQNRDQSAFDITQAQEAYHAIIQEVRHIIKGNIRYIIRVLKENMKAYAEAMEYEKANVVKEKIALMEQYQSRSTVVSPHIGMVDVFTVTEDEKSAYVNYLSLIEGAIMQTHTMEIKKKLEETKEHILSHAMIYLRERFHSRSREIIVPFELGLEVEGITFTIPQRGDRKKLLDLSLKNAMYYRMEKIKQEQITNPNAYADRVLEQLQKDLRMPIVPRHIECFDNSNMQGSYPVAACVVFKEAKPSKKDYRHFNIKTVVGPDDYASMTEVVYRRYKRLMEEEQPLPQLIVIDGGKGQLSSALEAIDELGLRQRIFIVSIAKRLEEIYVPNDPHPLYIDKRSESLKLLQNLRNEAHRFGITHHRNKRSKSTIKSSLTDIPGIGEKTMTTLLRHFKSIKRLKETPESEVAVIIGNAKAKVLKEHLN